MSADSSAMNNGPRGYIIRVVLTIVVIVVYGWINFLLNPVATLETGKFAGKQFQNADIAYVVSIFGINFFKDVGIPALVLILVLIWIWWNPIRSLRRVRRAPFTAIILVLLASTQLFAYYDKADYTEAYFILPNESAFFIPDVGANKESQSQFGF